MTSIKAIIILMAITANLFKTETIAITTHIKKLIAIAAITVIKGITANQLSHFNPLYPFKH